MAIRFIVIRMSGGAGHEHITHLWWINPGLSASGDNARAQLVTCIENGGRKAYVEDAAGHRGDMGVVTPAFGAKYLRTHADGKCTNNLSSLPRR